MEPRAHGLLSFGDCEKGIYVGPWNMRFHHTEMTNDAASSASPRHREDWPSHINPGLSESALGDIEPRGPGTLGA